MYYKEPLGIIIAKKAIILNENNDLLGNCPASFFI